MTSIELSKSIYEKATGNVKKLLSISGLRDEDAEIYRIEIQRHLKVINHNKPLTTQKQNNDNQIR